MTPFGKMLRQERKDRGMLLADMAKKFGISSPYLSQLETGVKPLQPSFVEKVIRTLDLNLSDAERLRRAAAQSIADHSDAVTIELKPASARDRELASNFAVSFNRLKPEAKQRIREMLRNANNG
jgi:HTH-type transcriptional regulator, competence development regulator